VRSFHGPPIGRGAVAAPGVVIDRTVLPALTTAGATYKAVYRSDKVGTAENTLFQDTAGTVPVTAVGQSIACWKSSVGAFQLTQGTSTKRPTLQQRADGRYVVRFDGVDDELNGDLISSGIVPFSIGSNHAWANPPAAFEGIWHVGPLAADVEAALINRGPGFTRIKVHRGSGADIFDPANFLSPSGVIFRTQVGTSNLLVGTGGATAGTGSAVAIGAAVQYLGYSPAGGYGDFDISAFFSVEAYINDADRTSLKTWLDALLNL
jgi:hypothetical protein